MTNRHAQWVASLSAFAISATAAAGGDPWVDTVVAYDPGTGAASGYDDPATVLGLPERFTGEGIFPAVVSPFSPPFGADEIVSIGAGGALVVAFDEPVEDDPRNPFGIDLLVFGNAGFIDGAWPAGVVAGLFADGGSIEVSADGITWHTVATGPDGLFPSAGYLDGGPYDETPGALPSSFTRPVDPALGVADFMGLDLAGIRGLYGASGGGAGIDLAPTGLAAISFVRLSTAGGENIEIDALADVAPLGDLNDDGAVNVDDLLVLLAAWDSTAPPAVLADLDGDGIVGVNDLLVLLANWGG